MWENPEHPAELLARQVQREHDLSGPATTAQLIAICAQRGCPVLRSYTLEREGYYLRTEVGPLIVVRWDTGPHVLAHELYHHLVADNEGFGVIYSYPVWVETETEAAAQRFAHLLCAPLPVPAE